MCAIAGTASFSRSSLLPELLLGRWSTLLHHRGPDDEGRFIHPQGNVLLFHRRLAITGIHNGKQPLYNENGDIWLVFNGELYDYEPLRQQLQTRGHQFATASDAEVILHSYEEQGIDCLQHLRGEFAFALYDARSETLFLVRDRFGIKPLFYAELPGGGLVFSSEIKGVLAHPQLPRRFDRQAVLEWLQSFSFADQTLFEGVKQVPPAAFLQFQAPQHRITIQRYWRLPAARDVDPLPEKTAVAQFGDALQSAVALRLPKEVPAGAFLSGGLDSSAVVRWMQQLKNEPFPVFSIGFQDAAYNELDQAAALARQLNLPHHSITIGAGDLKNAFARYLWHAEMPVLNTHGVAKFLLARLARQHCKVVLTGEGADEILLGYEAFAHLHALEHAGTPASDRRQMISRGGLWARQLPAEPEVRALFGAYPYPMLRYFKLRKTGRFLLSKEWSQAATTWNWQQAVQQHFPMEQFRGRNSMEATQLFLLQTDLPAYILGALGDRPEMAAGLEGRTPFLDHKLVELACRLPENLKLRNGTGKFVLREAMKGMLDDETRLRPKKVFYAPALASLGWPDNAGALEHYLSRPTFKKVGIFSYTSCMTLRLALKCLPQRHPYYAVLEGVMVLILSIHMLHELFIERFEAPEFVEPAERQRTVAW